MRKFSQKTIGGFYIMKKFGISKSELSKLILQNKLHPIKNIATLSFRTSAVERFFLKKHNEETMPVIIDASTLMQKFKLGRADFATLLMMGELVPLPIKGEKHLYFGYQEVC